MKTNKLNMLLKITVGVSELTSDVLEIHNMRTGTEDVRISLANGITIYTVPDSSLHRSVMAVVKQKQAEYDNKPLRAIIRRTESIKHHLLSLIEDEMNKLQKEVREQMKTWEKENDQEEKHA